MPYYGGIIENTASWHLCEDVSYCPWQFSGGHVTTVTCQPGPEPASKSASWACWVDTGISTQSVRRMSVSDTVLSKVKAEADWCPSLASQRYRHERMFCSMVSFGYPLGIAWSIGEIRPEWKDKGMHCVEGGKEKEKKNRTLELRISGNPANLAHSACHVEGKPLNHASKILTPFKCVLTLYLWEEKKKNTRSKTKSISIPTKPYILKASMKMSK